MAVSQWAAMMASDFGLYVERRLLTRDELVISGQDHSARFYPELPYPDCSWHATKPDVSTESLQSTLQLGGHWGLWAGYTDTYDVVPCMIKAV